MINDQLSDYTDLGRIAREDFPTVNRITKHIQLTHTKISNPTADCTLPTLQSDLYKYLYNEEC